MDKKFAMVLAVVLAGILPGCGEDQPNAPAAPSEVNADFGKKSQDMMKDANSGMDLKKAQAAKPK